LWGSWEKKFHHFPFLELERIGILGNMEKKISVQEPPYWSRNRGFEGIKLYAALLCIQSPFLILRTFQTTGQLDDHPTEASDQGWQLPTPSLRMGAINKKAPRVEKSTRGFFIFLPSPTQPEEIPC
jgi:hypothetical protein